jgi:hypothetical protein
VMPDSVVSACTAVEGVRVLWISRYLAGGSLFPDLEVVESLTSEPETALDRLVEMLPVAFRCEWAARVKATADGFRVEHASEGAPPVIGLTPGSGVDRQTLGDDLVAVAPIGHKRVVAIGRRGGPEFLDSELARLGHLVGLAASIAGKA